MEIFYAKIQPGLTWLLLPFLLFLQLGTFAQQPGLTVGGKITDEKGTTLPGVTVRLKNSSLGVVSDINGTYSISLPAANGTLVFSFIGYVLQELPVSGQTRLNVVMTGRARSLNEVVVIGYGSQKRELVTGSIATVKAEDFNKGVISDPITLITGKVAGLAISRVNGSDPNSTAEFQLRGATSVQATSSPLIVIDGVPGGDLLTIAPADIESIDILRDGSAAAIYGSRATGGVIIVTTKKGKAGVTRVNYNNYMATESLEKRYHVLDATQYKQFALTNNLASNDQGANTDWFKKLTRTPFNYGHNLSVRGGTDKTTYNASVNYQSYQGIDLITSRKFVNGTMRLTTKGLNDKLDFSMLLANSFDNRRYAEYYSFGQSLNINPTYPVYNPDGSYFETPNIGNGTQWNPVANTKLGNSDSKEKRFIGTANLAYAIIPSLKAGITYSLTKTDLLKGSYTSRNLAYQQTSGLNGSASLDDNNTTDNIVEATLAFNKQAGDHSFSAIAGYSYQNEFNEEFGSGNNNFTTDAYSYYNLGAGSALNNITPGFNRNGVYTYSTASEWTLLSSFARLIYNYKERYLFNASVRREGASKLGANNKYDNFPAVSAGWILSKEAFLEGSNFVKNLKLRGGYGVTGNQQGLLPYQSLATIGNVGGSGYLGVPGNNSWIPSSGRNGNQNPNLTWEKKRELDLGIDFTLFNSGWLSGTLDYYDRHIINLIGNYNAQVPSQIYTLIFANAGLLTNKGVEFSLNAQVVRKTNFKVNMGFVSSYNQNKIVSVTSSQYQGTAQSAGYIDQGPTQEMAAGQPISEFYGLRFGGFTPAGLWLFKNKSGQPVTIDQITNDDYTFLGNSIPKVNLGLTTSISWYNFDLSFLIRSALMFKALNAKRITHENINAFGTSNLFTSAIKNPIKDNPTFSSYYLENGNYMKIDNVVLGYRIPFATTNIIKSIRVSVTASNLLTITKFSGMDPELGLNPYSTNGIELNSNYYPRTRLFTFALSADL